MWSGSDCHQVSCLRLCRLLRFRVHAPEAEAVVAPLNSVASADESVEERGGCFGVANDVRTLFKAAIVADDHARSLVDFACQLEA